MSDNAKTAIPGFVSETRQADVKIEGSYNGLPYRGPVLDLMEDDPEYKRPALRRTAHIGMFDLSDAAQKEAYENICTGIAEGRLQRSWEDISKVDKAGGVTWVACIRYVEEWYGPPINLESHK